MSTSPLAYVTHPTTTPHTAGGDDTSTDDVLEPSAIFFFPHATSFTASAKDTPSSLSHETGRTVNQMALAVSETPPPYLFSGGTSTLTKIPSTKVSSTTENTNFNFGGLSPHIGNQSTLIIGLVAGVSSLFIALSIIVLLVINCCRYKQRQQKRVRNHVGRGNV